MCVFLILKHVMCDICNIQRRINIDSIPSIVNSKNLNLHFTLSSKKTKLQSIHVPCVEKFTIRTILTGDFKSSYLSRSIHPKDHNILHQLINIKYNTLKIHLILIDFKLRLLIKLTKLDVNKFILTLDSHDTKYHVTIILG